MHHRIVEALRRLQRERRTGVFRTMAAKIQREVRLEAGAIVGARSSSLDERLGELMVRRGRITHQHLEDASLLVRSGRRLGDALVELELVDRNEVESFVRAQLAEITSRILTEPAKRLEFRDAARVGRVTDRPVPIADAILEAARRETGNHNPLGALLHESTVPVLTPEASSVLQSLSLQSHEAFVLSRCDGKTNVKSIVAQSPLAEETTAWILLGFEHAGIIELKSPGVSGH